MECTDIYQFEPTEINGMYCLNYCSPELNNKAINVRLDGKKEHYIEYSGDM